MTDMERYYVFGTWDMAKTPMCATCAHYVQHYAERDGIFFVINAGHCTYPRIKPRLPFNICEHYAPNKDVQCGLYYPRGFNYAARQKEG